jgi:hypothetical protein
MNSKQITDILLAVQATITLLISLRAFYLYSRTRSDALFSIGLSMGVIALGGICGLIGDTLIKSSSFNTVAEKCNYPEHYARKSKRFLS